MQVVLFLNLATPSLTHSSQGSYSGFQVTGWSNWDKNQPPKNKPRVSNKTQTTLGTPKNIFCFINNIMQNDNFKLFWVRKKSPRKWNCNQKNPEIENFKPKKIFQSLPSLEIRSKPPPTSHPTTRTHSFMSLVRKSLCRYPVKFFKASIYFTC